MKYRIKIVTLIENKKRYSVQFKKFFGWSWVDSDGFDAGYENYFLTRDDALTAIDKHYGKNKKEIKIEFEYITK